MFTGSTVARYWVGFQYVTVTDMNSAALNLCKTFVACVYTLMLLGVKLLNYRVYICSAFFLKVALALPWLCLEYRNQ